MKLAPIALFVYNRPFHTKKTLEALSKNKLANESDLYIFCDGPKIETTEENVKKIQEVRELARSKKWCKNVTINESEENKGLADSIVNGVNELTKKYGNAIVLEDDIVTHKNFLTYMNNCLEFYKGYNNLYQISAYMVPHNKKISDTMFYRAPASWGWATWEEKWTHFMESDITTEFKSSNLNIEKFNIDNHYDYYSQLTDNLNGTLKTWAVKWYLFIFLRDGLCVWPPSSYTKNIGYDGSGDNCNNNNIYIKQKLGPPNKIRYNIQTEEETDICLKLFKNFYLRKHKKMYTPKFFERLKNKLIKKNRKS